MCLNTIPSKHSGGENYRSIIFKADDSCLLGDRHNDGRIEAIFWIVHSDREIEDGIPSGPVALDRW